MVCVGFIYNFLCWYKLCVVFVYCECVEGEVVKFIDVDSFDVDERDSVKMNVLKSLLWEVEMF